MLTNGARVSEARGRKPFLIVQTEIVSNVLGLLGLLFILHYYGKGIFGVIAFTLAWVGTLNAVADLGFSQAHIRHLSKGEDEARCNGTYITVKLCLTGLMVGLVGLFLLVYDGILGRTLYDTTPRVVLIFALYLVLNNISGIAITSFNAHRETAKAQISYLMEPLIRVPLVVVLSLLAADPVFIYFAYVAGAAAVMVVALTLIRRYPIGYPNRRLLRSYFAFAAPLFVVAPAGVVASNIDNLLLGIFYTAREVGAYAAVKGLVMSLSVFYFAINTLSFPLFSRLESQGRWAEATPVLHKAERYLLLILLPTILIPVLFPGAVLGVVGIAARGLLLQIYAVAFAVVALGLIYAPLLLAAGRTDLNRRLAIVYLLVLGGLCLLMIPTRIGGFPALGLGALGGALAFLIASLFKTLYIRFLSWRTLGIPSNPRIVRHASAGALTGVMIFTISRFLMVSNLATLLTLAITTFFLHFVILFALRELTAEDLREIRETLHPGLMKDYVVGELRNH